MKKLSVMFLLLMTAACAYSPQQIQIRPELQVTGEQYGQGRAVAVAVDDQRAQTIIGTRGGVYAQSSIISVGNSLTAAIAQATTAKLAAQGFSVNGTDADTRMTVIVDKIAYDLADNGVLKKVVLDAEFRVALNRGDKSLTTRYQTGEEYEVIKSPSPERNEELINKLISETLERVFVDPKVKQFLVN